MKYLLLGCGHSRVRHIRWDDRPADFSDGSLTTVDFNSACAPDILCNLDRTPWPIEGPFDEIHAYEVMEHLGRQGDFRAFFAHFYEVWRLLTPGGFFCGTSPRPDSPWAWGDPGHTRIISKECLTFLSQQAYIEQAGRTAMTDYRSIWHGDLLCVGYQAAGPHSNAYILQRPAHETDHQ